VNFWTSGGDMGRRLAEMGRSAGLAPPALKDFIYFIK